MQFSFSVLGVFGLEHIGPMIGNFFLWAIYSIFMGIAQILDFIQLFFRKLAGIDTYVYNGELVEGDIIVSLIQTDVVKNVFWSLVILAILLLVVCTIVAVVKTEWNWEKDGNSKKKVINNVFRALFNMVLVPIFCIFGINLGNALLSALDGATAPQQTDTFSSMIWITAAYNSNKVRDTSSEFYQIYFSEGSGETNPNGYNKFGIFVDSGSTVGLKKSVADKIDDAFLKGIAIPDVDVPTNDVIIDGNSNITYKGTGKSSGFAYSEEEIAINVEVKQGTKNFDIYNYNLVRLYYDIFSFDFIIAIGGVIFLCWIMLTVVMGLIKRMFTILVYFCIVPPIIAITPLDEGAAFKKWRQTFIGAVISAYSAVVVMNLFLVFVAALGGIEFFYSQVALDGFAFDFLNYLVKLLIIIGGGLFVKDSIASISSMIGGDDLMKAGDGKWKDVANVAGKGVAMAAGVAGLGAKAFNSVKGFAGDAKNYGLGNAFKMAEADRKDKAEAAWNDPNTLRGKLKNAMGNPGKSLTQAIGGKTWSDTKGAFNEGMGQKDKDKSKSGGGDGGVPDAPSGKMSRRERLDAIFKSDAYKNANGLQKEFMADSGLSGKFNTKNQKKYDGFVKDKNLAQSAMDSIKPEIDNNEYNKMKAYIAKADADKTKSGNIKKTYKHYSEYERTAGLHDGSVSLTAAELANYNAEKTKLDSAKTKIEKLQQTTKMGVGNITKDSQQLAKDKAATQSAEEKIKQEQFEQSIRKKMS